jgi:hypothetical protein
MHTISMSLGKAVGDVHVTVLGVPNPVPDAQWPVHGQDARRSASGSAFTSPIVLEVSGRRAPILETSAVACSSSRTAITRRCTFSLFLETHGGDPGQVKGSARTCPRRSCMTVDEVLADRRGAAWSR